jgi:hypothetical protein
MFISSSEVFTDARFIYIGDSFMNSMTGGSLEVLHVETWASLVRPTCSCITSIL